MIYRSGAANVDEASLGGGVDALRGREMNTHWWGGARRTILDRMRNATFCLSMPGDSASTRRLSETIMAGCIPVFLGPPYASMPLAGDVAYREFAVFINITDYAGWLQDPMDWQIHPTIRPYHVLNPWTWLPELEVGRMCMEMFKP